MKLKEEDWAKFGRWMMAVSGLACLSLGLYWEKDFLSWLLRIWVVLFGIYCLYLALFK